MPFIQVDKAVHHYTVEGANSAPALVFSRLLLNFLEGISSA
jgi:hypothetical protein